MKHNNHQEYNYNHVLYIGPEDKNGGIGAVLKIYNKYLYNFKLLTTNSSNNLPLKVFKFSITIILYCIILINDKFIKIIHLHSASNGSFTRKIILSIIGKAFNKKIIFHIHGGSFDKFATKSFIYKKIIQFLLKKMNVIICLSESWKSFFETELDLKNIFVLGNPIELKSFGTFFDNSNTLKLLYLGSLNQQKGIFDFIEYLKSNKYFKDKKIILSIGGIGDIASLQKSLENTDHQIEYLGWLDDIRKDKALNECDIFILPSYIEGLPVSILEALAYSKPIIATNVGGITSIVKSGINGWIFNPGNFQQLDEVFDEIFKNDFSCYNLNSYVIASQFSTDSIFEKLSKIYSTVN